MTPKREAAPTSLRSLEKRIDNLATQLGRPVRRIQRAVANTVVGQMLPPGVVKGGTAMKLRVGEAGSRFTPDFDAARASSVTLDDYLDELGDKLAAGWGGFTGTVSELDAPEPEGVPEDYVMRPFDIRLAYRSRHWLTVRFELGHDEIGSTKTHELRIAGDIIEMFDILGLDTPGPVPLLAVPHQIAQKLHACTAINPKTGRNDRAHDLVDLQLLDQEEIVDIAEVAAIAARVFASPTDPSMATDRRGLRRVGHHLRRSSRRTRRDRQRRRRRRLGQRLHRSPLKLTAIPRGQPQPLTGRRHGRGRP